RNPLASDPHLRQEPKRLDQSSVDGSSARVAALAVFLLVVACTALLSASQLARLSGGKAASKQTAFLTKALGSPQSSAPLVRKPSLTQTVRLHRGGAEYPHGIYSIPL